VGLQRRGHGQSVLIRVEARLRAGEINVSVIDSVQTIRTQHKTEDNWKEAREHG
jgi:hypothetical protein